jgi:methionine-S-sulfoxide reductase
MKSENRSKITSVIILIHLIINISLINSACGEATNKNRRMENIGKMGPAEPDPVKKPDSDTYDTITLGGGCFWCVEAVYERLDGVVSVVSGFSGGTVENPSYREVCTGLTGHAEVVQITYDTTRTSLDEILKVFFTVHDPTTLNRQGPDVGTQYRSVIFYSDERQRKIAGSIIADLNNSHAFSGPIVTKLDPFKKFYKAEDYHQEYYDNNKDAPYCRLVIQPKLEKFEKVFKERLKK